MAVNEAEKKNHQIWFKAAKRTWRTVQRAGEGRGAAYLNWQKMSAYSAEMLEACSTVTLKVNRLPTFRCSRVASSAPSRHVFSVFSGSSAPAESKNDAGENLCLSDWVCL